MEITSRIILTEFRSQDKKEIETRIAQALAHIFDKYRSESVKSVILEVKLERPRTEAKITEQDEIVI